MKYWITRAIRRIVGIQLAKAVIVVIDILVGPVEQRHQHIAWLLVTATMPFPECKRKIFITHIFLRAIVANSYVVTGMVAVWHITEKNMVD